MTIQHNITYNDQSRVTSQDHLSVESQLLLVLTNTEGVTDLHPTPPSPEAVGAGGVGDTDDLASSSLLLVTL